MTSPHPESKWTHAICESCYAIEEPGRQPIKLTMAQLIDATIDVCCFCGNGTQEGIFYRKDPESVHG
jgi:hypothetical protein